MGATKELNYQEEQKQLAVISKAMSHPARIAILQFVVENGECINTELVEVLGLAQPTVSQHLAELRKANLILGRGEGTRMYYRINLEYWQTIEEEFQSFFGSLLKSVTAKEEVY